MPLTKIQARERAKRNRNRLNMMGMRQLPGTMPHVHRLPDKPAWVPMAMPFSLGQFLRDLSSKYTPRWMRRPAGERPPEAGK